MMFSRKVVRCFKVVGGVTKKDFNISFGIDSITLIGSVDNMEAVVTGTKKGIKHFTNQHHNLIKERRGEKC